MAFVVLTDLLAESVDIIKPHRGGSRLTGDGHGTSVQPPFSCVVVFPSHVEQVAMQEHISVMSFSIKGCSALVRKPNHVWHGATMKMEFFYVCKCIPSDTLDL